MEYVGRVAVTQKTPTRYDEVYAWISREKALSVGSLVIIENPSQKNEKMLGLITDIQNYSQYQDPSQEYYSFKGIPTESPLTEPTVVKVAKIRILVRPQHTKRPVDGRWLVRLPTKDDSDWIWKNIIPEERKRILAGFTKFEGGYIPVYLHADFLLGPEGAHVNISGMTGLATKTSYARFLTLSILSWAQRSDVNEKVAIVLFNVKRFDFLGLHNIPHSVDELFDYIDEWRKKRGLPEEVANRAKELWQEAIKNGVNPSNLNLSVKYFTYEADEFRSEEKFMSRPQIYKYGLRDLRIQEMIAGLFEEETDATISQINLLEGILEEIETNNINISFDGLIAALRQCMAYRRASRNRSRPSSRLESRILEAHPSTVEALYRKLKGFVTRANRIIDRSNPRSSPIKFNSLISGINVVQLYGLNDTEKRIVVNAVLRELVDGMTQELRKPLNRRRLHRVVVVIDELNKYAPKAKSPIKELIIDVAARGRDLQISLIGAEQFASNIDSQVLGNCATRVVGRTDYSELSSQVYGYLGELKYLAKDLEKGEMILHHALYPAPFVILFPPPVNDLWRAYQE